MYLLKQDNLYNGIFFFALLGGYFSLGIEKPINLGQRQGFFLN
jgi:hypothetical protein